MWVRWLEEQIGAVRGGQRVLVLCRTRATVSLVRRLAARRGGWLGVEAATPAGLAQQVRQPPLLAGPVAALPPGAGRALPPDTELGRRLGDRPGLAEIARRWVQQVRRARAVGEEPPVPAWLEELLPTPFGLDDDLAATLELCVVAAERGRDLHAGATWDRVVALGFDDEAEALEPTDRHLAAALAGHTPRPLPEADGPFEAWHVPDVTAEAAAAVHLAAADPEGTTILVSEEATARRIRDALRRNGIDCAFRENEALSAHPVASAVRRAAAWFAEGPDPALLSADLEYVFARSSLGRRLHPAAEAFLDRRLAPYDEAHRHVTRRRLVDVLDATRLLDAPLSTWIRRAAEIDAGVFSSRADRDRVRAASHHLLVRLLILRSCLESRPLDEVLGEHEPGPVVFDADDFEDVLSELLGDELPSPTLPAGGTFGALKAFLVHQRLRVHDDPVGRAVLGALHRRRDEPCTLPRVHEALAGSGLDPGVCSDGVDVVAIEDWDGRPCRTLVVADVHDHGLTRRSAPDPLLTDDEIRALGALAGGDRVHHRLRTLRRAAGRADRTVLLVTRRDASGREVVAPIQLDLAAGRGSAIGSYGAGLASAEAERGAVLRAEDGPPLPPTDEDPTVRFLATQATLEWVRDGRGGAAGGQVPSWLGGWLGSSDGVPEAALPEGPHSVSRLLAPLARCPWQAFARVVLRVDEPPSVAADLDPRELGTAVHLALEHAAHGVGFFVGDREPDEVRQLLAEQTSAAFDEVLAQFGVLSAARRASAEGRRDRWRKHWESWVRSRARWPTLEWPQSLYGHPDVVEAEALFRARVPAAAHLTSWDVRAWILARARAGGAADLHPDLLRSFGDRELPAAAAPDLVALLNEPLLCAVGRAVQTARDGLDQLTGRAGPVTLRAAAAEIPFGEPEAPGAVVHGVEVAPIGLPEAVLRLGGKELRLRGKIDRVEWVGTAEGVVALVADWKTSRSELDGKKFRTEQYTLQDPQLLVYAMVLERASREGLLPEVLRGRVAAVAHDRLLHTVRDREAGRPDPDRPDTWLPVEPRTLRGAALQLGVGVDRARSGRWPLTPLAETCPRLSAWGGRCDVAAGCRLRRAPHAAEPDGETP